MEFLIGDYRFNDRLGVQVELTSSALTDHDNTNPAAGQLDIISNEFIEFVNDEQASSSADAFDVDTFLSLPPVDDDGLWGADFATTALTPFSAPLPVTPFSTLPPLTPFSAPPPLIPDDGYSPIRSPSRLVPGEMTVPPTPEDTYVYPYGDLDLAQYTFSDDDVPAPDTGLLLDGCQPPATTSRIQVDPNIFPSYMLALQNGGVPQYPFGADGFVTMPSETSRAYGMYTTQSLPVPGVSSSSVVLDDVEAAGPSTPTKSTKRSPHIIEDEFDSGRKLKGRKSSSKTSRVARERVNASPLNGRMRTKAQRDYADLMANLPPVSPLVSPSPLASISTSTPTSTSRSRGRGKSSTSTPTTERNFLCDQCGRRYKTQILLDEHIAFTIDHDVFKTDAELPSVRWVCPKHHCPFTVPTSLQRHCVGQGCMGALDAWCVAVGISRKEYLSIKYSKDFCPMARGQRRDGRWARRIEETVRRGGFVGGDVEVTVTVDQPANDNEEESPAPDSSA